MYLLNLTLDHVKMIEHMECTFARDGAPRPFTLLVGENGMCKTTVLRAIALAAVGPTGANQLAGAASFPDRRVSGECTMTAVFLPTHRMEQDRAFVLFEPGSSTPRPIQSHIRTRMKYLQTLLRDADVDPGWEPEPRSVSGTSA
jgi:hypothetical protein